MSSESGCGLVAKLAWDQSGLPGDHRRYVCISKTVTAYRSAPFDITHHPISPEFACLIAPRRTPSIGVGTAACDQRSGGFRCKHRAMTGVGRNRNSRSGVRNGNKQTFVHMDCQRQPSTHCCRSPSDETTAAPERGFVTSCGRRNRAEGSSECRRSVARATSPAICSVAPTPVDSAPLALQYHRNR